MSDYEHLKATIGPLTKWVWRGSALVAFILLGIFSVVEVEPGEAACRVNNLTGTQTSITQQGWQLRIPIIHSMHVEDASPQTFQMSGEENKDRLHVKKLTVRANDGSNFSFDDTSIIFKLKGDEVCTAIRDSGLENGYRKWMRPYGRTIPRDEFGRESTLDVSDPTQYSGAVTRTENRLNEALAEHSIFVQKFTTPKPVFSVEYEKAIESRNGLENEKTVISSNLENAETTRERTLAEVNQAKNKELQVLRASLESALALASANQADKKRTADTRLIEASGEGQAALSGKVAEAKQLKGQLAAEYKKKFAEINAFRSQPTERVMEVLGEKLRGVTIHVQPYANDATPTTIDLRKK